MDSFRLNGILVLCVFLFVGGSMHVCAQYDNVHSNQPAMCIYNPCPVCCNCEANTCRGDCKDGYNGGLCKNHCPYNCIACKDHSDPGNYSGYANCTQCKDGYYVTSEWYQCQLPCPSGCEVCSSDANCSECIPGFYGNSCDKACSVTCLNDMCDQFKGSCLNGCKNNFEGNECKTCLRGWFGLDCNQTCSVGCKNDTCDQESGYCEDCKETFNGTYCEECTNGITGVLCSQRCHSYCASGLCDRFSANCLAGCLRNFAGPFCDRCIAGKFGVKETCSRDCPANCLTETCEESSGKCYDCTGNFIGHFCELCVPGQYGPDCMDICPGGCTDRICDRTTGHCASCLTSQYGPFCEQMCPENCLNGSCHQLEHFCLQGCVQGYYGGKCETEILSPTPTSSPYTSFQIATIILSAALGFLSGVILALWFLR